MSSNFKDDATLAVSALVKILKPIVKFALAKRLPIQTLIELLKKLYVSVCIEEFSLKEKRLTDSRISLLTGLQRKDIKVIRAEQTILYAQNNSYSLASRLITLWKTGDKYTDKNGYPVPLHRVGASPSFEGLVSEISQDVHPRTLQDDLLQQDHIEIIDNKVVLLEHAYLPSKNLDALFGYFGNNLGDHTQAAVENVLANPKPGPFFERAVHYNSLSKESLIELESLARKIQQEALEEINAKALTLQENDKDKINSNYRFRSGTFIFSSKHEI